MIALTSQYFWYSTRATGIVSLLLFTIVMATGVMTATRVGGTPMPRFAVAEIHRRISLLACLFLAIHIVTSVLDSYVNVGILGVFIPFMSPYKQLWVAMGAISLDLMLAVMLTSLVRKRISHDLWRAIHWISYLAWPIALIHALFIGTDVRFSWMDLFVMGNVAIVVAAGIWRVWKNPHPEGALTAVPQRTAPNQQLNGSVPIASQRIAQERGQQRAPARSSAPQNQTAPTAARPIASTRRRQP